jgi:Fe-S cluster assembly iron-binding protein IscA
MLQVSEQAAMALEAIRRSEEVPESHGTRLSPADDPGGDLAIRLEFVEETRERDQVAEQSGTEVYVDSELAEPLSDAVMDVEDSGEGLTFVFRSKAPEA